MFNILVVEDDQELNELFCSVLYEHGYKSFSVKNGMETLALLENQLIDLIILDVMMPKMDGFILTKTLRDTNYTMPILMVTARSQWMDKKTGFQVGVDDYMIKPVDIHEMLWRIKALLRRSQKTHEQKIHIGSTMMERASFSLSFGGEKMTLPQKEFLLLFKLLSSPNRIFTKLQILDDIWGVDVDSDPHTVEVHINRLRKHLKNNQDFQIVTIRGLGYKAVIHHE